MVVATGDDLPHLPQGPIIGLPHGGGRGCMGQESNAERRIREVAAYCRAKQSVCMESSVTSTSQPDQAEQAFSPQSFSSVFLPVVPPVSQPMAHTPEVSITPVRSPVSPPAIFRPPGLVDSEEEGEDIKPDMMYTTTTFPTSYPSMLRLLHPHLYRHYHPYLHYTNTMLGHQYQGQ